MIGFVFFEFADNKIFAEKYSGKQQRCSQSRVKDCDKHRRCELQRSQKNTARHHYSHYYKGFYVEELNKKLFFFSLSVNSLCVLFNQSAENKKLKYGKHDRREQKIHRRQIQRVFNDTDT